MELTHKETKIKLVQGDITLEATEAIVNAANSTLLGGGGVDGAIHRAGGPKILEECKVIRSKQGGCPTGESVITTAGNLPSNYVIHTVGPIWQGGNNNEPGLLANAYKNSLELAYKNKIKTIAFPSISTGVYNYPIKEASIIALQTVKNILDEFSFEEVRFILFSEKDYNIYLRSIKEVF
ncbi:O-acetyl-ADP-ribose deacetylase [Wukongibacter baidiensis]|uniref:O-acetyl-ADP-ribose deacetylase n=1 Tax=Wukongibacter baidiensis TaxID=1723361 RepID=UPI003D7F7CDB